MQMKRSANDVIMLVMCVSVIASCSRKQEPENTRVAPHEAAQPALSEEHSAIIALADEFARKKHPGVSLKFKKITETREYWSVWYDIVELKDGRMSVVQQLPSDQLITVSKQTKQCKWIYGE